MTELELKRLFDSMTMEEKVMQLVQIPGGIYDDEAAQFGNETAAIPDNVKRLAGATIGIQGHGKDGTLKIRKIQEKYMASHPHHIPLLFMADVIHGLHTVFPIPLGQGASFDPALTRQAAEVQADEASAEGLHVTFSPMVDLVRDARWGRVMESTGEDKTLNSQMAAAMVQGYQGSDLEEEHHLASCFKHFAAYGAADAGRDYNNTEISEHTLREFYLPSYRAAVDAGARMGMSSFNSWNGIPASGSEFLLRKILREEWGFENVVISDWDAIGQLIPHGYAEDLPDAAEKAIRAGVDIDMCTGAYSGYLPKLLEEGKIDPRLVEEAALRVLKLKNDLGLFENPFRGMDRPDRFGEDEKRAMARKAVAESLVMLKNEASLLPLRGKKIALIGPYAESTDLLSSWARIGDKLPVVSLAEAAGEAAPAAGMEIRTAPGCAMLDNDTRVHFFTYHQDDWADENDRLLNDALEAAQWADTVVLCLGEHPFQSGEATSRTELDLPETQLNLLRRVSEVCPNIATLIFCGRPLILEEAASLSRALMICWLPGTEGGHGIWDVLSGRVSPSGALPMSFPRKVGQEPLHYDEYPTGRPEPASGFVPFTTHYLDCPVTPLFPFGFGLSYGDVSLSPVTLSAPELRQDTALRASVVLKNNGSLPAAHTVQLYVRDLAGSRVRPVRELKDYRKVVLQPGESQQVSFEITEPVLRFWRGDCSFGSEKGRFQAFIGLNSATDNGAEFRLI